MEGCIFCKIIKGKIPSYTIWENDEFMAFLDIFPLERGMTLITPKQHLPSYVVELDNEVLAKLLDAMREVAKILDDKLQDSLRTTFLFEGIDVDHLHVKLIPFYKDKLESHKLPKKATDQELSKLAQYLRS